MEPTKLKRTAFVSVLCMFASILLNHQAHAIDVWWLLGGDGNWENSDKWSDSRIPSTSDAVLIEQGTVQIGSGVIGFAGNLTMLSSSTAKLDVINGGTLEIANDLTITNRVNGLTQLTVSGSGSQVTVGNETLVGALPGSESGFLEVSHGATFTTQKLYIGDLGTTGTVILADGTIRANRVTFGLWATSSAGIIEIAGTGGGRLLDLAGNPVEIKSDVKTGLVRFTHTGESAFANILSGSISIENSGTGTTILSGASNITGKMTITDGNLRLANVSLSVAGGTNVRDGSLGGTGTIMGGRVTVFASAHLEASLILAAGLTLNDGAYLDYVEGSHLALAGGDLVVDGKVYVNFSDATITEGERYNIIDATSIGGLADLDTSLFAAVGAVGIFQVSDGWLIFQSTAVIPEASSYAIIIGLALLVWVVLRQRISVFTQRNQ